MSQHQITNAGLAYRDEVFAGAETTNITKFVFANVPGLQETDPVSPVSTIPTANVVHEQAVHRVSALDGNAIVMSATLDYTVGDFDYNWYGVVAEKADGKEVLIAVVHTSLTSKRKNNGIAQTGDFEVKSVIWRSSAIAATLNVTLATLPWQMHDDTFVTKDEFDAHTHNYAVCGPDGTSKTITDWNNAIACGFYMGNAAENGVPGFGWLMGVVQVHHNGWITQHVHAFTVDRSNDSQQFRRDKNNGNWSDWYPVEDNIAALDARYNQIIGDDSYHNGLASTVVVTPDSHGAAPNIQLWRCTNGLLSIIAHKFKKGRPITIRNANPVGLLRLRNTDGAIYKHDGSFVGTAAEISFSKSCTLTLTPTGNNNELILNVAR